MADSIESNKCWSNADAAAAVTTSVAEFAEVLKSGFRLPCLLLRIAVGEPLDLGDSISQRCADLKRAESGRTGSFLSDKAKYRLRFEAVRLSPAHPLVPAFDARGGR